MKEMLQEMVNGYGFGISVEEFVEIIYHKVSRMQKYDVGILNERYLEVDGRDFQFRKTISKGHWTVVEF